jgi:hypothetical protein
LSSSMFGHRLISMYNEPAASLSYAVLTGSNSSRATVFAGRPYDKRPTSGRRACCSGGASEELRSNYLERIGVTAGQDRSASMAAVAAVMHRSFTPTSEELNTALEIVEGVLAAIFVHGTATVRLGDRIPPRPPRAPRKST